MVFDKKGAYLFKDTKVVPSSSANKERFSMSSGQHASGMEAATRTPNTAEVYDVPLHGRESHTVHRHQSRQFNAAPASLLTKEQRQKATPPASTQTIVFDDNIPLPSKNQSNMEAETQRLHD